MTQYLELAQFVYQYRVAEMQIWCGRVKSSLDAQRSAASKFLYQFAFQQNLICSSADNGE